MKTPPAEPAPIYNEPKSIDVLGSVGLLSIIAGVVSVLVGFASENGGAALIIGGVSGIGSGILLFGFAETIRQLSIAAFRTIEKIASAHCSTPLQAIWSPCVWITSFAMVLGGDVRRSGPGDPGRGGGYLVRRVDR